MLWWRRHISIASAARWPADGIIAEYGISPELMGWIYSSFLIVLHAGDVAWRLVYRPFWCTDSLLLLGFSSAVFVALTGVLGMVATGPSRCGWDCSSCGRYLG